MKITVKVTPHAKTEEVMQQGALYLVKVRAVAKEGKANDAVIKLLAAYFNIPRSAISIKIGLTNRNKIVEIKET
ncbi:MAG TPA: hypothetical protein DCX22_01865 [Dehalococcoidia bacterium]|nr:hypothetical protein [Dehalococcoidia bacterium]